MKMRKRILSMLTALTMLMSLVPSFTLTAGAEDITTISSVADLVAFRDSVNGGNDYSGKTVTLTADIDLSGVCGENIGGAEVSWTPIGDSRNQFKGTFDGGNNKITGLYINALSNDEQGLFGYIGNGGTVKNLGVDGTVTGNNEVGGVVGNNNGTITNCYSNCTVIGNRNVGGVVGRKADGSGIMSGCYNTGAVTGINIVGGVLGINFGTVMNCYNTGTVTGTSNTAGGVVGNNVSEGNNVTNCYNIGTVTDGNIVGGVIGIGSSNVTSCYYLTGTADGGINGSDTAGNAEAKTADAFAQEGTFSGWDFETVWTMSAALGRPILAAIPEPEPPLFKNGDGTEANPYIIPDLATLKKFRDSVNGGETYEGKFIKLTADIDLSGVCGENIGGAEVSWTPIGDSSNQFKGTFDGGNNKITGLYINAPSNDYQGLFGYIGEDSTVKNLGVDGTVLGKGKIGGIVGYNGTVQNCCNTGTVTGTGDSVGGIVGYNGTVQNCYNTGTISSTGNNVGGLVGWNTGNAVQNCYNTGAVSGGSNVGGVVGYTWNDVTKCYSVGTVTGTGSNVGGVVGYKNGGNPLTSCYYDSTVNTTSNATIGVAGMPTADFAEQTNFSDWDFDSVWKMSASLGRPILTAIPEPEPHKHPVCGTDCTHEGEHAARDFDHALTSENGKLYIDGAVLEPTVEEDSTYTDLPDGNYYLAEDVTLVNFIKIQGGINLCLNGHKLNMGGNRIIITKTGNLSLCDCGEGGQITGAYSGAATTSALIETRGEFSMYGGSVMNTSNDELKNKQAVSTLGGTVRLYGGEVVSHNGNAVMVDPNTGASLHLSGEPVIQSLTYDKADIYLDNDYSARIITLDAPLTITSPYRVAADGENVFTSGWNTNMSGKDFSEYFISATRGKFIAKDENNELKIYDYAITAQPSAANSYTITANGAPDYAPASYKWYSATVKTENVTNENAQTAEPMYGGEGTSSYDSETGWTGAQSSHDGTFYFKTYLYEGDTVKVKPSKALREYGYVKLEGSEGMFYANEPNADGEYEITVEDEGEYTLSIDTDLDYDEAPPTVTAKVVRTEKNGEVRNQETNQLTAKYAGSYLCEVRYEDGTVLTSNVFDYTPSAPPAEHKHDMSVSCGHDSEIVFDKVLTSDEDGNLYINDAIVPDSPDFRLDDGNYYLADNLSLNSGIEIIGDVNLCLNGKTLEFKYDYHHIDVNGDGIREIDFNICDCGEGGKITGAYSIDVDYLGLINNSDTMSLYGGTIENSSTDTTDGKYQRAITNAGMLNLYGGEIISKNDDALASAYNAMKINLAGNTKITGADSAADIFLYKSEDQSHAGDAYLSLLLISDAFANIELAKPYRISADSADVVAFFTRGWSDKMGDKEIGKYFTSAMKGHGIRKNTDGELEFYALQITEQPSEDNGYTITAAGEPTGYQWYSAETDEAVSGQTSNQFTGNADGKYYCIVTFADGATVKSEEIDYKYTTPPPAEHKHPVCGASCTHEGAHTEQEWIPITYDSENEILWAGNTEIEADNGKGYTLNAGNYYLAEDITLKDGFGYDGHITINKATNLCLNDHTLNGYVSASGYEADFSLCDCSENKTGKIEYAGTSDHGYHAAVAIGSDWRLNAGDAAFTMYSGSVIGKGENTGLSVNTTKAAALLGGSVKGGNESEDIIVSASVQNGAAYTPLAVRYAIPSGTRIGAYWGYDRSQYPDPPVVKGAQGYTLTNSDLANVTVTAKNEDHSSINFAKKLKDNQIVLEEVSPSPSSSASPSPSPSPSVNPDASPSPSPSPSVNPDVSPSPSPSVNPDASPSPSPSANPTDAPTRKPSTDVGSSSSSRVKATPKPTSTPSASVKPTDAPSATDMPSETGAPSETSKPSGSGKNQHKAYIMGYKGMFSPDGNVTRAETAAMLARLADSFDENGSYSTTFSDVEDGLWYYGAIGFAESQNIITGYEDGSFKPEGSITRAEFASMIAKIAELDTENADMPFKDAKGHWAAKQIAACYAAGYIKGYTDNTFRPDSSITRAEAVTIINRVLDRNDIKDFTNPFNDVSESHWAYKDIMEAAITHNIK